QSRALDARMPRPSLWDLAQQPGALLPTTTKLYEAPDSGVWADLAGCAQKTTPGRDKQASRSKAAFCAKEA
ncbi:MAG: hypothetical protein KAU10_05875, partial [Dehalococcoidia bacterium]|nr:hypothetical protein [Dehalococcoidia bacterium]